MSDEPNALAVQQDTSLADNPTTMLQGIMALARDPSVRVDVIERLVSMQERMEDRQAERDFATALHLLQAECPRVKKNGTVSLGAGKGSYAFARREDIDDVLRVLMDKHGFSVVFTRTSRVDGGGLAVAGIFTHSGGHSRTLEFPLPIDTGPGRNNLQALGSTDKYAQRYILEGFANIVRENSDDDGKLGGTKFISEAQADELRAMCKDAGRQEGPLLQRLFAGQVHSFEEVEAGPGYLAARSTLQGILQQQQQKRAE